MKKMKKIFALLCAMIMTFAMAIPVSAAEKTYMITIQNNVEGHTYEAYQIFDGDLADGKLSNIVWGSGVDSTKLLAALKADTTIGTRFANATTAADVAKALEGLTKDSQTAQTFAAIAGANLTTAAGTSQYDNSVYTIPGLAAGYYLVKDQDKSLDGDADAYTRFIVEVVGDVEAAPKSSVPSVEKKVQENAKYNQDGGYGEGYNDVADWNIGDKVPFKLIGTMPSTLADYTTYKYVFHDTMSAGLTYNGDAKVYLVNGATKTDITTAFTTTVNGQSFDVASANVKTISGITTTSQIVVEYTATLNTNAVIGRDGNPNEVYLEFSNDPNQSGEGAPTGQTPVDKVIVFTYELDVTKVDGADTTKTLAGAEFKLQNAAEQWVTVDADGKVTGWVGTEAAGSTLTSGDDGIFKVIGLDDGTYNLKETKAPAGFNTLAEPIKLVISATTANNQSWAGTADMALTALTIQVGNATTVTNGDVSTGIVGTTVENNSGSVLPATGGIGTKIFYAVGAILMIGAGVLLVTRKRMNK